MTQNFDGLYDIRDMVEGDKNLIYNSFLKSVYYGDTWFSKIPKRIFMENYKRVLDVLLSPTKSTIKIACLPDDPGTIMGYSILSLDCTTVHFVYVKRAWRRYGIARRLLPTRPMFVSHLTAEGETLLTKFESEVLFNPFSI